MKKTIFFIFCFTSLICFSQNNKAKKLYDDGVKAFNQNDLKTADSLFKLSADLEPHRDTYYNLAMVKQRLNDFCGYCDGLYNASLYDDTTSIRLYNSRCLKKDTMFYENIKEKNINYYCVTYIQICSGKKARQLYKKKLKKNNAVLFEIINTDSLLLKEEDIYSPFFEIDKVPDSNIVYLFYDEPNLVHFTCDEMPTYPGGRDSLWNWVYDNLNYPRSAKEFGIERKVYVSFIVDEKGQVTNAHVLTGIDSYGDCDAEALRVVKVMPKWNPGKENGKPIKVRFIIPITFSLIKPHIDFGWW